MSSVSQVANSGEIASLELFGCRTDSPPMSSELLSVAPTVSSDASGNSLAAPQSGNCASDASVIAPVGARHLATAAEVAAAASAIEGPRGAGSVRSGVNGQWPASNDTISKLDTAVHNDARQPAEPTAMHVVPKRPKRHRKDEPAKASACTAQKLSLHRIAKIREQQGISERTMARRLGMDVKRYRELEDPQCDLSLTQLIAIQTALEVPIGDLLEDRQGLSRPVEERAKMLKIMKTAVALKEAKISARADRMAQMLCEQLIELMPELAEVSGWPQFGARRGASAIGKALQQPIDTSNITFQE